MTGLKGSQVEACLQDHSTVSDVDRGLQAEIAYCLLPKHNSLSRGQGRNYLPEVWRVSAGASKTALDRAVAEPE